MDWGWCVFYLPNQAPICIAMLNRLAALAHMFLKLFAATSSFVLVLGFVLCLRKRNVDDVERGIHLHCILSPQARTVTAKARE